MKFTKEFKDVCKVVGATTLGLATVAFTAVAGYFSPQDLGALIISGGVLGTAMGSYVATVGKNTFDQFKRNGRQIIETHSDKGEYQQTIFHL